MQILVFHLAGERAALATQSIRQVLPYLALMAFPEAPPGIAGLMNLHGQAIPVVDLSALGGGSAARARQDTRILLVDYPLGTGRSQALGLIAEGVVGVRRDSECSPRASGVTLPGYPWLSDVLETPSGLLHWLTLERLLPPSVATLLFREAA